MELLEKRILSEGRVLPGEILKVDNFLNHQIDVELIDKLGEEFARLFRNEGVNKILTIEASGIAVACFVAKHLGCKLVFAKKSKTLNISDDVYFSQSFSYTHKISNTVVVSKNYLCPQDRVLIIDDFLANGEAMNALIDICASAGASVAGCGAVIEKVFQGGGERIRSRGVRLESLARIKRMTDYEIEFC